MNTSLHSTEAMADFNIATEAIGGPYSLEFIMKT